MKKTIFDLKYEEGRKVDMELRKTSYFKQYILGYAISICMLILIGSGLIFSFSMEESTVTDSYLIIPIMIMVGFASLFTLLFWFKKFDLIKKYYEEKSEK